MIFTLLLIGVAPVAASCFSGTFFHQRDEVKTATFGYTYGETTLCFGRFTMLTSNRRFFHLPVNDHSGERGPFNWANLSPNNTLCSTGRHQSPIVLDDSILKASSNPTIEMANVEPANVLNLGYTLQVFVNGTTRFEGKEFRLVQYHFHTPSEHFVEEEHFPLEMHMVHESGEGEILVFGLFFELTEDGTTTDLLTKTTVCLDKVEMPGSSAKTGPLDFAPIIGKLETQTLYHYSGSLTTPPCSEGVIWLVMKQPLPMNAETYNAMKHIMKFNARYTQNSLGEANLLALMKGSLSHEIQPNETNRVQSTNAWVLFAIVLVLPSLLVVA